MTDFGGKTSIFSHPVYLFLRKFSLQDSRGGSPYLNLAALNEFSDGNKVRLGDESVNASIDGAAFRVGAGVQADITKNMGAYASLDYTKGDDIENPLQGVVGINVTW
ncbi:autotransporter outer membrane beta-barrel domain-containing protein [Escherichia coli]|uniref:autotransporter outer membrane beta-barrel domain-containing protein n=1 Tax=Escherichia coli TaxID=562 RepID=UPI001CC796C8|nr:autotransporter outer membrane beta-barrel domain-containing protein [Escherichia coli]